MAIREKEGQPLIYDVWGTNKKRTKTVCSVCVECKGMVHMVQVRPLHFVSLSGMMQGHKERSWVARFLHQSVCVLQPGVVCIAVVI